MCMAPGTVTGAPPRTGISVHPLSSNSSSVTREPDLPEPLILIGSFLPGRWISAKPSPPQPVLNGSTMSRTATVATAASTAFPPC